MEWHFIKHSDNLTVTDQKKFVELYYVFLGSNWYTSSITFILDEFTCQ
jgi:hypothetical protein